MASSKRIINVGASARASDVQKVSDVAAAADDRATEILCTPGSTLKTIKPLSEESATVNPRLLVVGKDTDATLADGKVRVRPAHFQAGSDAYTIALSAALKANADSPTIGNNSSGSTRYDLVYAVISYGTVTTETVRQKPTSGSTPVSVSLTTQKDMLVTIAVVAGVAAGSPLASLPADDTVNGVYNFGLAVLAIPNGYAGGAINQSVITPLWDGGWVLSQRVRLLRPVSLYASAPSESPGDDMSDRFGHITRFFAHFNVLSTTPIVSAIGTILDQSIDWRHRLVWFEMALFLGSGTHFPLKSQTLPFNPPTAAAFSGSKPIFTGNGCSDDLASTSSSDFAYDTGSDVFVYCDSTGKLRFSRGGTVQDPTNGDAIAMVICATPQFLAGG